MASTRSIISSLGVSNNPVKMAPSNDIKNKSQTQTRDIRKPLQAVDFGLVESYLQAKRFQHSRKLKEAEGSKGDRMVIQHRKITDQTTILTTSSSAPSSLTGTAYDALTTLSAAHSGLSAARAASSASTLIINSDAFSSSSVTSDSSAARFSAVSVSAKTSSNDPSGSCPNDTIGDVKCPRGHKLLSSNRDDGWSCDGSHLPGGCRRGLNEFHKSAGVPRFTCEDCNYDLCDACKDSISVFALIKSNKDVWPGYRLARVEEVERNLQRVKRVITYEWAIVELEDGEVSGHGYGWKIQRTKRDGYGEKLITVDATEPPKKRRRLDVSQLEKSIPMGKSEDESEDESDDESEVIMEEFYVMDIYHYLLAREKTNKVKPRYMTKQTEINHRMRAILIDWLIEVSEELQLSPETLYITVNLIDRFLSKMVAVRSKLQLVGAAALLVAAKYKEIDPPGANLLIHLTEDCYTIQQLFRMEDVLLKVVNYEVSLPNPESFLVLINKFADSDEKTTTLSKYIVELSLMHGEFYLSHPPSLLSASAVCVARHKLGYLPWSVELTDLTSYDLKDLGDCSRQLCDILGAVNHLPKSTVREKYSQVKYHEVACFHLNL